MTSKLEKFLTILDNNNNQQSEEFEKILLDSLDVIGNVASAANYKHNFNLCDTLVIKTLAKLNSLLLHPTIKLPIALGVANIFSKLVLCPSILTFLAKDLQIHKALMLFFNANLIAKNDVSKEVLSLMKIIIEQTKIDLTAPITITTIKELIKFLSTTKHPNEELTLLAMGLLSTMGQNSNLGFLPYHLSKENIKILLERSSSKNTLLAIYSFSILFYCQENDADRKKHFSPHNLKQALELITNSLIETNSTSDLKKASSSLFYSLMQSPTLLEIISETIDLAHIVIILTGHINKDYNNPTSICKSILVLTEKLDHRAKLPCLFRDVLMHQGNAIIEALTCWSTISIEQDHITPLLASSLLLQFVSLIEEKKILEDFFCTTESSYVKTLCANNVWSPLDRRNPIFDIKLKHLGHLLHLYAELSKLTSVPAQLSSHLSIDNIKYLLNEIDSFEGEECISIKTEVYSGILMLSNTLSSVSMEWKNQYTLIVESTSLPIVLGNSLATTTSPALLEKTFSALILAGPQMSISRMASNLIKRNEDLKIGTESFVQMPCPVKSNQKNKNLSSFSDVLKQEMDYLKKENKDLFSMLEVCSGQLNYSNQKVCKQVNEMAIMRSKIFDLLDTLQFFEKRHLDMSNEITSMVEQQAELQENYTKTLKCNRELQSTLEEERESCEKLQLQFAQTTSELETTRRDYNAHKELYNVVQKHYDGLKEKEASWTKMNNDLTSEKLQQSKSLDRKNEQLKEIQAKLISQTREAQELVDKLNLDNKNLSSQVTKLQKDLDKEIKFRQMVQGWSSENTDFDKLLPK